MNTIDELAREIARHWDGQATARVLVREYGLSEGFPVWLFEEPENWEDNLDQFKKNVDELVELVTEEIYGERCDPVAISNIGKRRPVWI